MATTEATLYAVKNGAAWITLNRPENRNALSSILVLELYEHLLVANDDPKVRCIVITGTDPAFCAGADLKERRTMDEAQVQEFVANIRATMDDIAALPQPTGRPPPQLGRTWPQA